MTTPYQRAIETFDRIMRDWAYKAPEDHEMRLSNAIGYIAQAIEDAVRDNAQSDDKRLVRLEELAQAAIALAEDVDHIDCGSTWKPFLEAIEKVKED